MNYINSENKNGLWELEIKGIAGPILASDYLDLYGSTPDEARTASIKKKIVVHSAGGYVASTNLADPASISLAG